MGFFQIFKRKPSLKDLPPEATNGLSKEMADMVEVRAMALFTQQWDFYRTGYYTLLRSSTIKDVFIGALLLTVFFLAAKDIPRTDFVAVDPDGKLTKLEPVNMPVLTDEQVRNFVREAISESFTFNYSDLDQRVAGASKYWTDKGYALYNRAINESGLKEQIIDKRLLLKTVVDGAPVIKDKGVYGGRHVWVVSVNVIRSLSDRVKSQDAAVNYTFYLYRVPSTERTSQIAIYQYNQTVKTGRLQ